MYDAYIYDGIRSPFGRYGGALSTIRPDDLLASSIGYLIKRHKFNPALLEDVIAGNSNQAGEDSRNVARNAVLISGLPETIAGISLNRLCGSGVAAVLDGARTITAGEADLLIACGVESMSRSPWVIGKADRAFSRQQQMYDSTLGWRFPNFRLTDQYGADSNSETADNIAKDLNITREDSDEFALASQQKYTTALSNGFYSEEIMPVETPGPDKKTGSNLIDRDEHPRPDTTLEKLASLGPLSENGVVTAGNASGINDGAAALILGSKDAGDKIGMRPRGRIIAGAVAGIEPRTMGLGPVPATEKVIARSGLGLDDMDVIEINEAFATQVLGCLKQMNIGYDDERINPNGGAIAIGHPLGASGARLVLTALRQLEAIDGRYALVTMCIGIGQGIATVIERIRE